MVRTIRRKSDAELNLANDQVRASQNVIAYDSKEYVVEVIVKRFEKGQFFIPEYQRDFVWSDERRCKFIESVMMGLPIPYLFGVQTCFYLDKGFVLPELPQIDISKLVFL